MDQSGEFVAEVEVLTESSGNNGNMDKESEVIRVEAVQRSQSRLNTTVVEELVTEYIRNQAGHNTGTLVTGDSLQGHLGRHVEALIIDGPPYRGQTVLVHVYRLYDEADEQELPLGEQTEDTEDTGAPPPATHVRLPCRTLLGTWEALLYEDGLKDEVLKFAIAALEFADKGVSQALVSWNRLILLHGPPGTGKTALCRALAQKLSVRMKHKYTAGVRLVEIDSHSLFSRWFSESGKAVVRLFDAVRKLVEMENGAGLVCLLVDEVESLVRCRSTALSGTEPSDSMRAVNALLTQLDKMRRYPNVLMLTTSNMTGAIDNAFADRADLKRYVGPPSEAARYEIYRTSVAELNRVGIITGEVVLLPYETLKLVGSDCSSEATEDSLSLLRVAQKSAGLSGRTLRKIPFLARALHLTSESTAFQDFVTAMEKAIEQRLRDDVLFDGEQTTLNGH